MLSGEQRAVRALFHKLIHSRSKKFPAPRGSLDAPERQGAYIFYNPEGRVLHVGRTPSGVGVIRQRLSNHLHNASSFTNKYLKGHGKRLRQTRSSRCLVVTSQRQRALLEPCAIGHLCPAHIGLGVPPISKSKRPTALLGREG